MRTLYQKLIILNLVFLISATSLAANAPLCKSLFIEKQNAVAVSTLDRPKDIKKLLPNPENTTVVYPKAERYYILAKYVNDFFGIKDIPDVEIIIDLMNQQDSSKLNGSYFLNGANKIEIYPKDYALGVSLLETIDIVFLHEYGHHIFNSYLAKRKVDYNLDNPTHSGLNELFADFIAALYLGNGNVMSRIHDNPGEILSLMRKGERKYWPRNFNSKIPDHIPWHHDSIYERFDPARSVIWDTIQKLPKNTAPKKIMNAFLKAAVDYIKFDEERFDKIDKITSKHDSDNSVLKESEHVITDIINIKILLNFYKKNKHLPEEKLLEKAYGSTSIEKAYGELQESGLLDILNKDNEYIYLYNIFTDKKNQKKLEGVLKKLNEMHSPNEADRQTFNDANDDNSDLYNLQLLNQEFVDAFLRELDPN